MTQRTKIILNYQNVALIYLRKKFFLLCTVLFNKEMYHDRRASSNIPVCADLRNQSEITCVFFLESSSKQILHSNFFKLATIVISATDKALQIKNTVHMIYFNFGNRNKFMLKINIKLNFYFKMVN